MYGGIVFRLVAGLTEFVQNVVPGVALHAADCRLTQMRRCKLRLILVSVERVIS
jgi:hypothetical protein